MTSKKGKSSPEAAGEILRSLLKELGVDQIMQRHEIWSQWEEIVGTEIAAHTRPAFFSGNCLFITVDHSTWMQQLTFLKSQMLQNINATLENQAVSELRFRLGPLTDPGRPKAPEKETGPTGELNRLEEDHIERTIESSGSPELKERLRRLMTKDTRHRKSRGPSPR
ncbi:MAG: DUF721 domain-containing protein [bacterium]|nr:DUF721 domain-containing protein [bacterium]